MAKFARLASIAYLSAFFLASPVNSQTFTDCDPTEKSCAPDTALGRSIDVSLTSASSQFTSEGGTVSYGSDGGAFTIEKALQAPTLVSKWYIMFGSVSIKLKAAPGQGIVTSVVLLSDSLDEIDFEFIGGDNAHVQTNFFGQRQKTTETFDRMAVLNVDDTTAWHTYTIDWTPTSITYTVDGSSRTVLATDGIAQGQYPQSPCRLKIGTWAGGSPGNSEGTIEWAGGKTDFSQGPFSAYVSEVKVTDYSTGNQYSYGDKSGTWESIVSTGGKIMGNADGSAGGADEPSPASTQITSTLQTSTKTTISSTAVEVTSTTTGACVWAARCSDTTASASGSASSLPAAPTPLLYGAGENKNTNSTNSTENALPVQVSDNMAIQNGHSLLKTVAISGAAGLLLLGSTLF